ncbi:MAG: cell division protein FtsL [Rhodospirillales bacterium]
MNARAVTIASVLTALTLGLGLYMVKYRVLDLKSSLTEVNRAIAAKHESMHVLKAEWSLLNNPARLQELSARLLGMTPVAAGQIKPLDAVPFRPSEDEIETEAAELALKTGGGG